jgi:hypothetical protein
MIEGLGERLMEVLDDSARWKGLMVELKYRA